MTDEQMAAQERQGPSALSDEDIASMEKAAPQALSDADMAAMEQAPPPSSSAAPPAQDSESTGQIGRSEILAIASKHGVNPNTLEKWAPFMGVSVKGQDKLNELFTRTVGAASEGVLMGAVPFAYKKLLADEKEETAMDDLRELVEQRKSGTERLFELGAGLVVPVGGGAKAVESAGKLAKIAHGAAIGAGYGAAGALFQSRAGEEAEAAAKGAASGAVFGGALGAVTAALSRAKVDVEAEKIALNKMAEKLQDLEQRTAARLADPVVAARKGILTQSIASYKAPQATEELAGMIKAPSETILRRFSGDEDAARMFKAQAILDRDVKDFASFLSNGRVSSVKKAQKILEKQATNGEEFLARQYDKFAEFKEVQKMIEEGVLKRMPMNRSFMDRARLAISDARNGAARILEQRLPINLEKTYDDATELYNIFMTRRMALQEAAADITEKALRLTPEQESLIFKAFNEKQIDSLPADMKDLANSFATKFKEGADIASKEFGVNVKWKEAGSYLPHMTKDATDISALINARWKALGQDTARLLTGTEPEALELRQALEFISGKKMTSAMRAEEALNLALNPVLVGEKQATSARFFNARVGEIPDFLLEKNPAKLLQSWYNSTFRHLYMRDTIAELNKAAKIALQMGDKNASDYLVNHIKDLSGVRRGSPGAWTRDAKLKFQTAMLQKAEEAQSAAAKRMYKLFAAAPEANTLLFSQIYPNFLGLSPKATLQNLTQPLLMTVPELGWGYGSKLLMNAYATMASASVGMGKQMMIKVTKETAPLFNLPAGSEIPLKQWSAALLKTGKVQQRFNQEMGNELARHLQDYAIYRHTAKTLDTASAYSMKMFEAAENLNRSATSLMALQVASHLLGEDAALRKSAITFVNQMGSSYQVAVRNAVQKNDKAELGRLLTNYLVGKTMFNYNRITMSEYGRFMGPMLSVFTKWPTSIAGDIMAEYSKRGALGGTAEIGRRYMAPLALLYVAGAAAHDYTKDNPWAELFLGKQGLEGVSPIASAKGLLTGEMAAPPAVTIPRDIVMGVATADTYKIWRAANETFNAFTPVVPLVARTLIQAMSIIDDEPAPKGTIANKVAESMGVGEPDKAIRDFSKELKEQIFGE